MKLILLCIILFFAIGVAMMLVARLSQTQQRLSDLGRDLKRTDEELARQRLELQRREAQLEAEEEARRNAL